MVAFHSNRSFPAGPAEQLAGGSFVRSFNSFVIRLRAAPPPAAIDRKKKKEKKKKRKKRKEKRERGGERGRNTKNARKKRSSPVVCSSLSFAY